jgi:hypothetical protein
MVNLSLPGSGGGRIEPEIFSFYPFFVLVVPLKLEQADSFESFIQLIIISSEANHFISKQKEGEES